MKSHLGKRWALMFEELSITTGVADDGAPITMFSGIISDQIALHGILRKIENMNLTLISVNRIKPGR